MTKADRDRVVTDFKVITKKLRAEDIKKAIENGQADAVREALTQIYLSSENFEEMFKQSIANEGSANLLEDEKVYTNQFERQSQKAKTKEKDCREILDNNEFVFLSLNQAEEKVIRALAIIASEAFQGKSEPLSHWLSDFENNIIFQDDGPMTQDGPCIRNPKSRHISVYDRRYIIPEDDEAGRVCSIVCCPCTYDKGKDKYEIRLWNVRNERAEYFDEHFVEGSGKKNEGRKYLKRFQNLLRQYVNTVDPILRKLLGL